MHMYHVIRNCYITFTGKKMKGKLVNEKFSKLQGVYRDCIKITRDKTRIYSIPHDAPGA